MARLFSIYVIAFLVLLAPVLGVQCVYPKLELHLLLNSCHTPFWDVFFQYYSVLAEFPLYVLALLPLLWKQSRLTLFFALSELLAGGLLQILKHIINMPRPVVAFEGHPDMLLPVVEGVSLHHGNSFPSGHASTFFVFFTCCALFVAYRYGRKYGKHTPAGWVLLALSMLLILALAALGAYSRVYLSQHFLCDITMGSVIGFTITCLMYYFGRKKILKIE